MTAMELYLYNLLLWWSFSPHEYTYLSLYSMRTKSEQYPFPLHFLIEEKCYHGLNTNLETQDTLRFFIDSLILVN